jgi:hypothetical protein
VVYFFVAFRCTNLTESHNFVIVYLARAVPHLNSRQGKPLPVHVKCLIREMHVAVAFMVMFAVTASLLIVPFTSNNLSVRPHVSFWKLSMDFHELAY